MRQLFLMLTCFLPVLLHAQVQKHEQTIYFESGIASLSASTEQELMDMMNKLSNYAIDSIRIIAHTDASGSREMNVLLGLQRATSTTNWLTNYAQLHDLHYQTGWISKGQFQPIATNETVEGRALNRRAEIAVWYSKENSGMTIKDLYNKTNLLPQRFCINNSRDTVLVAEHGTLIYIRANSISKSTEQRCKQSCTFVEVTEALFKDDIVAADLSTTSNGNTLVSQSMVKVTFKNFCGPLSLLPGKDYVILAPTDSAAADNKVFTGSWDDSSGHINWNGHLPDTAATVEVIPINKCDGGFKDTFGGRDIICTQCHLFFCGLGKMVGSIFSQKQRIAYADYLTCRQQAKKSKQLPLVDLSTAKHTKTDSIYKLYKTNKSIGLADSIKLKPSKTFLLKKNPCGGLSVSSSGFHLNDSLLTEQVIAQSVRNMQQNGNPINFHQLENLFYNVYSLSKDGWSNIDWMLKVPDDQLKTIIVNLTPTEFTDCKIIFRKKRTILPAPRTYKDKFTFPLVPAGEPARLLIINTNTLSGNIRVQLLDIVTGEQIITPELQTIPLGAFPALLKQINAP